jgi:hypothetical protein
LLQAWRRLAEHDPLDKAIRLVLRPKDWMGDLTNALDLPLDAAPRPPGAQIAAANLPSDQRDRGQPFEAVGEHGIGKPECERLCVGALLQTALEEVGDAAKKLAAGEGSAIAAAAAVAALRLIE